MLGIIVICMGIVLMTYQSYALWTVAKESGESIVSVGCFEISYQEESNTINLENTYPMSDEKGLTLTPYTFTITNTCTAGASYEVTLNTLTTNTMNTSWLKYALYKEGETKPTTGINLGTITNKNTQTEELQIPNLNESLILTSGELNGRIAENQNGESVTYHLYLWMDKTTGNEAMNTTFEGSINIISSAINKTPNAAEYITLLANTSSEIVNDETADQNLRYIGANPNNYVYFNCEDYNNPTSDTCELWRIIGVMNNMEPADGTTGQSLVKLVRAESIGSFSWDNKPSGVGSSLSNNGSNNWTDSRLMMLLNPGYETPNSPIYEYEGSLYYNAKGGTCYAEENNGTVSCDFTSTGLQNDTTRNMIEDVVWHLGGTNQSSNTNEYFSSINFNNWYTNERGNAVAVDSQPSTWTGKVGLIYMSDYFSATTGGTITTRNDCLNSSDWTTSEECFNNNWLFTSNHKWTLSTVADYTANAFYVSATSITNGIGAYNSRNIHPSLYLSSDVKITGGDGSSSSPFILTM